MRGPENPVGEGQFVNCPAIEPDDRGRDRFSYKRFLTVTAFVIMSGYIGIMAGIGVSRWLDPEMTTMSVLVGNILGYAVPLMLAKRLRVLD